MDSSSLGQSLLSSGSRRQSSLEYNFALPSASEEDITRRRPVALGVDRTTFGSKCRVHIPSDDGRTAASIGSQSRLRMVQFGRAFGPAVLACVAFMDPGNIVADMTAGSSTRYELLWALLLSSIVGVFMQALAVRLGVVTEKHLAELCRDEFDKKTNFALWVSSEITVIAADIPEVLGTALALNVLTGLPVVVGVMIAVMLTFILLSIDNRSLRALELLILGLIAVVFIATAALFGQDSMRSNGDVAEGILVPTITSRSGVIVVSIFGSMIMPHNLYLHSALVLSRKYRRESAAFLRRVWRLHYSELGMMVALTFVINVFIVAVSADALYPQCKETNRNFFCDPSVETVSNMLQEKFGKAALNLFGIALLASGLCSAVTTTYAGQFAMEGFLRLSLPTNTRNLLTRSFVLIPTLIITGTGGSHEATNLIFLSQVVLSFNVPFTVIPLLKFVSSKRVMGAMRISQTTYRAGICVTVLVTVANFYAAYYGIFGGSRQKGYIQAIVVVVTIAYFAMSVFLMRHNVSSVQHTGPAIVEDPFNRQLVSIGAECQPGRYSENFSVD